MSAVVRNKSQQRKRPSSSQQVSILGFVKQPRSAATHSQDAQDDSMDQTLQSLEFPDVFNPPVTFQHSTPEPNVNRSSRLDSSRSELSTHPQSVASSSRSTNNAVEEEFSQDSVASSSQIAIQRTVSDDLTLSPSQPESVNEPADESESEAVLSPTTSVHPQSEAASDESGSESGESDSEADESDSAADESDSEADESDSEADESDSAADESDGEAVESDSAADGSSSAAGGTGTVAASSPTTAHQQPEGGSDESDSESGESDSVASESDSAAGGSSESDENVSGLDESGGEASDLEIIVPGPSDISQSATSKACQPKRNFPKRKLGSENRNRGFTSNWYKYKWLEYSVEKDAVFCQACRFFAKPGSETVFTVQGFRDWKDISEKLKKHHTSHNDALGKLADFRETAKTGTVKEILDPETATASFIEKNRNALKVVLSMVLFCGKQELPTRGHREGSDSYNKGNFLELRDFLCKHSEAVKAKLDHLPENAKLTGPKIQNDLLHAASHVILSKIRSELDAASLFAILADECKDLSKRELVGVSIRYVHDYQIKERAVGFVETADMTAQGISKKILEVLEFFDLEPENCVGFSFDGASVMAGHKNGVQAVLKTRFQNAIYCHCHSHRWNLVMSSVSSADRAFQSMFDLLDQVATFFGGSNRHAKFVEVQKENNPTTPVIELGHSSDTRWTARCHIVAKVIRKFSDILETLAKLQLKSDSETQTQAAGLLARLSSKHFVFVLLMFNKVFQYTNKLTIALQNSSLTLEKAKDYLSSTRGSLRKLKKSSKRFDKITSLCDSMCEANGIPDQPARPQRRTQPNVRHADFVVTGTTGASSATGPAENRRLWLLLITAILDEMDRRFNKTQMRLMDCAEACLPESKKFMKFKVLDPVLKLAGIDADKSEAEIFKRFVIKAHKRSALSCLVEVFEAVDEDVFPSMGRLYQYLLTQPITTCTVERMFSTVGRVKNKRRTTMLTARLSSLSIISFEQELVAELDEDAVIEKFKAKPRRLLF